MYKKKRVMAVTMSSEINMLARELNRISEMNRRTRDFTLDSLRRALVEFVAYFPVYRTYVTPTAEVDERDAITSSGRSPGRGWRTPPPTPRSSASCDDILLALPRAPPAGRAAVMLGSP